MTDETSGTHTMSQNPDDPAPPEPPSPHELAEFDLSAETHRYQVGWRHEDVLAILIGGGVLLAALACGWAVIDPDSESHPWKAFCGKPGSWVSNPLPALAAGLPKLLIPLVISLVAFGASQRIQHRSVGGFLRAFFAVFVLTLIAFLLSGQETIKHLNLEYALWALLIGLVISNTVGIPDWIRPALLTELYVKAGLVILGAEVLLHRLLALGLPGVFVAWVVTPVVLISTYWFGQRVLKIPSPSLNMVISADMSVCGVSAAIATAASCRAKKEELSLAIGLSLIFTVVMMVVLPLVAKAIGLNEVLAGAWIGGTVDSTGAVVAAGATLGPIAEQTAATVKMIQNILIGVTAFGVAVYWVTSVERDSKSTQPRVKEIWTRFPKFVLGFVTASILATVISRYVIGGEQLIELTVGDATKNVRTWFFGIAFVCIGLETRFADYAEYLRGGKPLVLYVCGQTLNLVLTLLMVYLMFGILFRDTTAAMLATP